MIAADEAPARRMGLRTPYAPPYFVEDRAHPGIVTALESLGRAAVLIDAAKRIVGLNPSAMRLLGDGLLISQNRLRAAVRGADPALQALLEEAVVGATPQGSAGLALPRRGGRPLIVQVAAARDGLSQLFGEAKALVTLTHLDSAMDAGVILIAQAYALTPAETALCCRLAQGAVLTDAAEDLGVSVSTVRTHLKSTFLKTSTHRQSQLVGLLVQASCSLWTVHKHVPYTL